MTAHPEYFVPVVIGGAPRRVQMVEGGMQEAVTTDPCDFCGAEADAGESWVPGRKRKYTFTLDPALHLNPGSLITKQRTSHPTCHDHQAKRHVVFKL